RARTAPDENRRARHGFEREPDLWRAGRQRLQRSFRLHLLSSAVRVQSARRLGAVRPATRQRPQRRWLAGSARAGVVRYRDTAKRRYIRGDAAFANPEICEFLEAEDMGYAIRLPASRVLQNKIG